MYSRVTCYSVNTNLINPSFVHLAMDRGQCIQSSLYQMHTDFQQDYLDDYFFSWSVLKVGHLT